MKLSLQNLISVESKKKNITCNKIKPRKKIISIALAAVMLMNSASVTVFADNRDAGIMNKDSAKWTSSKYGKLAYESQNEGGFTVYVPYSMMMTGQERFFNMFTKLFDIYSSGVGTNYEKAFGQWTAPDMGTIGKITTKYYAKFLSTKDDDNESVMATSVLADYCPSFNIEYRYSGIMVDTRRNNQGTVVTNPTFASDFIQEGKANENNNERAKTYKQYNRQNEEIASYNLKLIEAQEVKHPKSLVKNYPGGSGIPSNIPRQSPYYDDAQRVFNAWAERTEIGAKYKAAYEQHAANMGTTWWKILQEYVRIDGDLDTQSVLLTMVYNDTNHGNHLRYKTYYIPFPIQNNIIAYSIQIVDDKGEITEKSERPLDGVSTAVNGADIINTNIKTGKPVELQRNKTYQAQLGMVFASTKENCSTTDKMNENARPQIQIWMDTRAGNGGGRENPPTKVFGSENASDMAGLNVLEQDLLDSSRDNTIRAGSSFYASMYNDTEVYHAGLAAYNVTSFAVDEQFPTKGHLRFIVPDIYTDNGDNEYKNDDYIDLDYVVIDPIIPDKDPDPDLSGDMNLGQREYRCLHYKKTIEEDDKDKPIMKTDPITGEKVETGEYEKKKVDYEYVTDYGWYDTYASSPDGKQAGLWDGVPEASGSIYPIDDHSWWEYDQQWPDQGADSYYKIWLTKAGESWSPNSETYYRSETADYPFTLGFSVSRSRGQETDRINPKVKVDIYGISPDTSEEGKLIGTQIITGNSIGTYQYSANNYMYLTDKYIAARYGNGDYPFIRVHAEIDKTTHGESGIYGDSKVSPYHNGWQDEHDAYDRTFSAIMDDMELTDIMVKDSEGIVIYHANRDDGGSWNTIVKGYFDKDEDYTLSVKVKQTKSAGHNVKTPSIDILITGEDKTGGTVSTYVDRTEDQDVTMGLDEEVTFDDIAFRPKDVSGVTIDVQINSRHNASNWRENRWDDETDTFSDTIQSTTANLKITPNIDLYNSKYNQQQYMTFAEKLNFKFDIQHVGQGERQMAIVGNSNASPLAKIDVEIYNADALTQKTDGTLVYSNVKLEDPKATGALIWSGTATAKTRLYPGLGSMNYASHVQAWINNYVSQSYVTLSGNKAAYGHILVTAQIANEMYTHGLNENTSPLEDYTQKEFVGEHNISIVDMEVIGQNSISDNSWYYGDRNKNKQTGEQIKDNPNGLSVAVALRNMSSSYTDSTVVDRTYLDIYLNDNTDPIKTVIVDLPQGDVVPVEVVLPDVLIQKNTTVTAKVNYGRHQTHYEYVLKSTNDSLNLDPFSDNVAVRTTSPNLPSTEEAPNVDIRDSIPAAAFE